MAKKFYVVWRGVKTGVFEDWPTTLALVDGFSGAQYKSFSTRSEAEAAFRSGAPARSSAPRSLAGISSLTSVNINGNAVLENLDGLRNVTSLSSLVLGNPLVEDLGPLSGLTRLGHLDVGYNAALSSLDGLGGVVGSLESLVINGNSQLVNLSGLDGVTAIMGDVEIRDNEALVELTGLDNVTSIDGTLFIYENAVLASLDGLGSVTSIGTDARPSSEVTVFFNPLLSPCATVKLEAQLIDFNGSFNVDGAAAPETCN
jgi:hypothetical protein